MLDATGMPSIVTSMTSAQVHELIYSTAMANPTVSPEAHEEPKKKYTWVYIAVTVLILAIIIWFIVYKL